MTKWEIITRHLGMAILFILAIVAFCLGLFWNPATDEGRTDPGMMEQTTPAPFIDIPPAGELHEV